MTKRTSGASQSRGRLLFIAICVSVGIGAFAVQALGSFGKPRGFAVGSHPNSVVIGDVNGDGKRDIAVANRGSGNVSILLGNGAGSFRKAKNFAAGSHPTQLRFGKLNGDGKRDIAVANGSGRVSILLGHGNGTFGPAKSFPAGVGARSLAIGDFNRDGKRDIAVVNNTGVSVLLGHGNGTFGAATSFPAGINPQWVVVGNFNGGANPDLAVANSGTVDCSSRLGRNAQASSCVGGFGTVSILLGNGDGSFGPTRDFPVGDGTYPRAMVVGNFNGDSKPDLALADWFIYAHSVSILLGKGAGVFGKPKHFAVGFSDSAASPDAIAVGDINHDSRDDLAVTSDDSKSVSVLLGRGRGSFGTARDYPTGASYKGTPTAVAIGNLDGGLKLDLAVAIQSSVRPGPTRNRVAVLLSAG
jgi:FG-GAP-like repeat/FG-GAP repeat